MLLYDIWNSIAIIRVVHNITIKIPLDIAKSVVYIFNFCVIKISYDQNFSVKMYKNQLIRTYEQLIDQ